MRGNMRTPRIDGRSIEQFIPLNLRDMFYRHSIPQYKYAIHDGYDPYGFPVDGLVAYVPQWALEGDSFESIDAYGHLCTVIGALWKPDGREFDGDDKIDCGDPAIFNPTTAITMMLWLKGGAVSSYPLSKFRTDGTVIAYHILYLDTGSVTTTLNNITGDTVLTSAVGLANSKWAHIAVSWDVVSGDSRLLVNGVSEDTGNNTTNLIPQVGNLRIGNRNPDAAYFSGTIGEVRLYNRALSPLEIQHNYLATKWRYQ